LNTIGVSPCAAAKVCGDISIPCATSRSEIAELISPAQIATFESARPRISVTISSIAAIFSGSVAIEVFD
jgi:hypothetical protein